MGNVWFEGVSHKFMKFFYGKISVSLHLIIGNGIIPNLGCAIFFRERLALVLFSMCSIKQD
jgi:hypothetical protein